MTNRFDTYEAHSSDSRDLMSSLEHNASQASAAAAFWPPTSTNATSPSPPRDNGSFAERPTLTVEETANLLGISRWLVQQAVRRGELPVVRIGRRILIPRARLNAMLAGQDSSAV
jgi:excisionase family DNA binding protein